MNNQRRLTIKDTITIGVLSGMCAIATSLKIPLGVGAMVHLGTAFMFTAAIVFGGVYAGLSAAIGSAFFDLLMGFSPYTPWSFFIKGIAGLLAGTIAHGLWPQEKSPDSGANRRWLLRAITGCLVAALWTLGGYLLAWWQVTASLAVAFSNIPASLLTSGVGLLVALFLAPRLRKALKR